MWLDDFGAGYSSLGLLSTFPLNVIKLDISFVRNFRQNEIVIENIIKMAHRLGLLTVAEGAETSEQVATLKKDYGIYMVGNGRISVAGITTSNIDALCKAIYEVLQK